MGGHAQWIDRDPTALADAVVSRGPPVRGGDATVTLSVHDFETTARVPPLLGGAPDSVQD
ncbi:hypothetical protein [Streptomyces vastus]|uniref:Uncharacterized protein n=1 Tax=Streptomyces vastus TaxID=285451 RepID=A0ABN3QQ83_9ACTN